MKTDEAIKEIEACDNVRGVRLWNAVPGKERIYVDTAKHNGGKAWNGGVGYRTCYIDINVKELVYGGEAGAATRKQLAPLIEHLTKLAKEIEL